jgi:plastocyanin
MRCRNAGVLATAVGLVLLTGCGADRSSTASAPPAPGSTITIRDFKFSPRTLTVERGARIEVENHDGVAHTLTADDGKSFDSGTVAGGGSATISVAAAGRFPYHCTIHTFMKGELVAQ